MKKEEACHVLGHVKIIILTRQVDKWQINTSQVTTPKCMCKNEQFNCTTNNKITITIYLISVNYSVVYN